MSDDPGAGLEKTGKFLITPREAAHRYGLCVCTLYRWASAGKIPAIRLSARCLRFHAETLDRLFLAKQLPLDVPSRSERALLYRSGTPGYVMAEWKTRPRPKASKGCDEAPPQPSPSARRTAQRRKGEAKTGPAKGGGGAE